MSRLYIPTEGLRWSSTGSMGHSLFEHASLMAGLHYMGTSKKSSQSWTGRVPGLSYQ